MRYVKSPWPVRGPSLNSFITFLLCAEGVLVEPLLYIRLHFKYLRAAGEVFRGVSLGRPHFEAQNSSA